MSVKIFLSLFNLLFLGVNCSHKLYPGLTLLTKKIQIEKFIVKLSLAVFIIPKHIGSEEGILKITLYFFKTQTILLI